MNTINHTAAFFQYPASNLNARVIVLAAVIAAHAALLSALKLQTDTHAEMHQDMSVSFEMAVQVQQPSIPRQQSTTTDPVSVTGKIAEAAPVLEPVAAVATTAVTPAVAVIETTEPDYKAAYLNNPPPAYPMVARRMGLQGRVMLSVEVLANGLCGQINIQKSSGYAMLDNAALETVKSWHFIPARQGGQKVDKWFMIPVQYFLRDNAA